MASAWEEYKKKLGDSRPWDFLNPNTEYVPEDVAEYRYSICKECPFFLPTTQCSQCGCFMKGKVKIAHAECPEHKWDKFTQKTEEQDS